MSVEYIAKKVITEAERLVEYRRIVVLESERRQLTMERDRKAVRRKERILRWVTGRQRIGERAKRSLSKRPLGENLLRLIGWRKAQSNRVTAQITYEQWCERYDRIGDADRAAMISDCATWTAPP